MTTSLDIANAFHRRLDELTNRRRDWENNIARAYNAQLYAILADCLQVAYDVLASDGLRNALKHALKKSKVTVQRNTSVETQVVKLIFCNNRHRASAYSIALRAAVAQNIKPADFSTWVDKQKGIEAIRLGNPRTTVAKANTPARPANDQPAGDAVQVDAAQADQLARDAVRTIVVSHDVQLQPGTLVMLATVNDHGEVHVSHYLQSPAAIAAVMQVIPVALPPVNENEMDDPVARAAANVRAQQVAVAAHSKLNAA